MPSRSPTPSPSESEKDRTYTWYITASRHHCTGRYCQTRGPMTVHRNLVCPSGSELAVHHARRGHLQVVPELGAVGLVEVGLVHRDPHAAQPRVALDGPDLERHVPHPQPRVTALLRVGARAAPVLLEEHPQPHLGRTEVLLRVERSQHLVLGDLLVEPGDELLEHRRAAHVGVELLGMAHGSIIPSPAGRARRPSSTSSSSRSARSVGSGEALLAVATPCTRPCRSSRVTRGCSAGRARSSSGAPAAEIAAWHSSANPCGHCDCPKSSVAVTPSRVDRAASSRSHSARAATGSSAARSSAPRPQICSTRAR